MPQTCSLERNYKRLYVNGLKVVFPVTAGLEFVLNTKDEI